MNIRFSNSVVYFTYIFITLAFLIYLFIFFELIFCYILLDKSQIPTKPITQKHDTLHNINLYETTVIETISHACTQQTKNCIRNEIKHTKKNTHTQLDPGIYRTVKMTIMMTGLCSVCEIKCKYISTTTSFRKPLFLHLFYCNVFFCTELFLFIGDHELFHIFWLK